MPRTLSSVVVMEQEWLRRSSFVQQADSSGNQLIGGYYRIE
jgi:hypothetical protein